MNHDCLTERFPDVKITDLIISKTGSTQCDACTELDPENDCSETLNFYGYDFLDSGATPTPLADNSNNLWFKAGECGSSMTINGEIADFQTTIFKPPTVDQATQIISKKTILATDIICGYPRAITGLDMDPNANVVPGNE